MVQLALLLLVLIIKFANASFWSLDINTVSDLETGGLSLNTLICITFGLLAILVLINIGCLNLIYCFAGKNELTAPINDGSDRYESD